jgi:hypothetical protein
MKVVSEDFSRNGLRGGVVPPSSKVRVVGQRILQMLSVAVGTF